MFINGLPITANNARCCDVYVNDSQERIAAYKALSKTNRTICNREYAAWIARRGLHGFAICTLCLLRSGIAEKSRG